MESRSTVAKILDGYKGVPHEHVQLIPEEAGIILGGDTSPIDTGTLANWRSTNKYDLKFVRIGSNIRYRLSDLLAFIEKRLMKHTGEAA